MRKLAINVGDRFGMLTVIKDLGVVNKHRSFECKCDCGNTCKKRGDLLNEYSSCGCHTRRVKDDIKGKVFGRLTVVSFNRVEDCKSLWNCKCSCGNECVVKREALINGTKKSCGCLQRETSSKLGKKSGSIYKSNLIPGANSTHGDTNTRFYEIFSNINSRCNNHNDTSYKNYGGRGIKNEWGSYENFKKDMFKSYNKHVKEFGESETTIERIDVNGNYNKKNCRWATHKEQSRNKRDTIYVVLEDKTEISLADFCENNGYSYKAMQQRFYRSAYRLLRKIPVHKLLK